MSYLSRENASISEELWNEIDSAIVNTVRSLLIGRKFLHIYGPLGIGKDSIPVDDATSVEEEFEDGFITTKGRKYVEIPVLYDDFTLLARDLERSAQFGYPVDLSKAVIAGEYCARKEDHFLFYGNETHGYEGLLNAKGIGKLNKSDWSEGENAFSDIAAALGLFASNHIYGTYVLLVSPDVLLKLQRIQPGTGLLEIDRIRKMLHDHVYSSSVLKANTAAMICCDARNMDLVIGQDLSTAYLEQKDLNHSFRILESLLLRIKRKEAIILFE